MSWRLAKAAIIGGKLYPPGAEVPEDVAVGVSADVWATGPEPKPEPEPEPAGDAEPDDKKSPKGSNKSRQGRKKAK